MGGYHAKLVIFICSIICFLAASSVNADTAVNPNAPPDFSPYNPFSYKLTDGNLYCFAYGGPEQCAGSLEAAAQLYRSTLSNPASLTIGACDYQAVNCQTTTFYNIGTPNQFSQPGNVGFTRKPANCTAGDDTLSNRYVGEYAPSGSTFCSSSMCETAHESADDGCTEMVDSHGKQYYECQVFGTATGKSCEITICSGETCNGSGGGQNGGGNGDPGGGTGGPGGGTGGDNGGGDSGGTCADSEKVDGKCPDSGTGTGNGFCKDGEFNKKLCAMADFFTGGLNDPLPTQTKKTVADKDAGGNTINTTLFKTNAQCPSDKTFTIDFMQIHVSKSMSFKPLCDNLAFIKPLIVALAFMHASFIIMSVNRG